MSTNPSPSGVALGLTMYRKEASKAHKARKEAKDKAKSSSKSSGADLESGTLNGTEWSSDESRDELYRFAKAEGLKVKSRDSKPKIIKALSDATKAQG